MIPLHQFHHIPEPLRTVLIVAVGIATLGMLWIEWKRFEVMLVPIILDGMALGLTDDLEDDPEEDNP